MSTAFVSKIRRVLFPDMVANENREPLRIVDSLANINANGSQNVKKRRGQRERLVMHTKPKQLKPCQLPILREQTNQISANRRNSKSIKPHRKKTLSFTHAQAGRKRTKPISIKETEVLGVLGGLVSIAPENKKDVDEMATLGKRRVAQESVLMTLDNLATAKRANPVVIADSLGSLPVNMMKEKHQQGKNPRSRKDGHGRKGISQRKDFVSSLLVTQKGSSSSNPHAKKVVRNEKISNSISEEMDSLGSILTETNEKITKCMSEEMDSLGSILTETKKTIERKKVSKRKNSKRSVGTRRKEDSSLVSTRQTFPLSRARVKASEDKDNVRTQKHLKSELPQTTQSHSFEASTDSSTIEGWAKRWVSFQPSRASKEQHHSARVPTCDGIIESKRSDTFVNRLEVLNHTSSSETPQKPCKRLDNKRTPEKMTARKKDIVKGAKGSQDCLVSSLAGADGLRVTVNGQEVSTIILKESSGLGGKGEQLDGETHSIFERIPDASDTLSVIESDSTSSARVKTTGDKVVRCDDPRETDQVLTGNTDEKRCTEEAITRIRTADSEDDGPLHRFHADHTSGRKVNSNSVIKRAAEKSRPESRVLDVEVPNVSTFQRQLPGSQVLDVEEESPLFWNNIFDEENGLRRSSRHREKTNRLIDSWEGSELRIESSDTANGVNQNNSEKILKKLPAKIESKKAVSVSKEKRKRAKPRRSASGKKMDATRVGESSCAPPEHRISEETLEASQALTKDKNLEANRVELLKEDTEDDIFNSTPLRGVVTKKGTISEENGLRRSSRHREKTNRLIDSWEGSELCIESSDTANGVNQNNSEKILKKLPAKNKSKKAVSVSKEKRKRAKSRRSTSGKKMDATRVGESSCAPPEHRISEETLEASQALTKDNNLEANHVELLKEDTEDDIFNSTPLRGVVTKKGTISEENGLRRSSRHREKTNRLIDSWEGSKLCIESSDTANGVNQNNSEKILKKLPAKNKSKKAVSVSKEKRKRAKPRRSTSGKKMDATRVSESSCAPPEHRISEEILEASQVLAQMGVEGCPRSSSFTSGNEPRKTGKTENRHISEDEIDKVSPWTNTQVFEMKMAQAQVDPTSSTFWFDVEKLVEGKSASECRDKWFSLVKTPMLRKKKSSKSKDNNLEANGDELLKADTEDDIFNSTPLRGVSSAKGTISDNITFDVGSPIIDYSSRTNRVVCEYDDAASMKAIRPRTGYKTYLLDMKRGVSKAVKEKKLAKISKIGKVSSCRPLLERVGEGELQLNAKLSPGGTLLVNGTHEEEDDQILFRRGSGSGSGDESDSEVCDSEIGDCGYDY